MKGCRVCPNESACEQGLVDALRKNNIVLGSVSAILPILFCFGKALCGQSTLGSVSINKEARRVITLDARQAIAQPHSLPLNMGGKSPNGHDIGVNSQYLTMDGKPWLPVMGEFHFSRYPERYWEEELLKIKAAGIQIVATYVFWIHHEEIEGEFDWSGQHDLRRFVELCRKHGLFVFVRTGPYAHGEVRNGGLPDWLLMKGPVRRNTPEYLENVRRYYGEIGRQLRGMLWKEGGPVVGIQLENEYFARGPDAGAAHISELKRIALECGLDAPLFTVTGWGDPEFPPREVMPVFGVYPDEFWTSTLEDSPPNAAYLFELQRDSGGIVPDPDGSATTTTAKTLEYPYLLAEAGGGMQVAYHRRPAISTDDVAAISLTHLGSGANLYGYYMFQGGANPHGKRTTLQESEATDHVYDLPVVSYDFQAPLGEFGQLRPSYRLQKAIHLFLGDFGNDLATMPAFLPDSRPSGPGDRNTPRVSLRADGERGFLFLNNYLRDYPMAEQKDLQFQIQLPKETITLPRRPVDIPSGSYFIWPLNLDLHGVTLKYSTAQLLCVSEVKDERYYFFFAPPGIAPEFALDAKTVQSIRVPRGSISRAGGRIYVTGLPTGTGVALSLGALDGRKSKIVLLPAEQARNVWKTSAGKKKEIVLSPADVFFDGNAIHLRSKETGQLTFGMYPPPVWTSTAGVLLHTAGHDGIFTMYEVKVAGRKVAMDWGMVRKPGPSSPVQRGQNNAVAPKDSDFDAAGVWEISIPQNVLAGLSDLFLKINYTGDVARLYEGQHLLADDFYNGSPWELGLKRFLPDPSARNFELEIMPLRKDAPIYLPHKAWPDFRGASEIAEVRGISAEPEYEVIVVLDFDKHR